MWNLNTFIKWFLCIFEIVNQLSVGDNLEWPINEKVGETESLEESHATTVDKLEKT